MIGVTLLLDGKFIVEPLAAEEGPKMKKVKINEMHIILQKTTIIQMYLIQAQEM